MAGVLGGSIDVEDGRIWITSTMTVPGVGELTMRFEKFESAPGLIPLGPEHGGLIRDEQGWHAYAPGEAHYWLNGEPVSSDEVQRILAEYPATTR